MYSWYIRDGDQEGIEKFEKLLFEPPAGVALEVIAALPEWQPEAMYGDFAATMASRGGGQRTTG